MLTTTLLAVLGIMLATPTTDNPDSAVMPEPFRSIVNQCDDDIVYVDINDLIIYGDQNGDHILSGDDCNWE